MVMSREQWYGSAEHFRTEMSYEEYLKAVAMRNMRKSKMPNIKLQLKPSHRW